MFQNNVQAEQDAPLVTVITLVYNTGKYINDTLDSIRNQSYKNIQHIIIDDCSKDDSAAIVEEWIQKNSWNCNFTRNNVNKGICANLNYAIKELAAGKYIAIIGDDVMMPDKISGDVAFMEEQPDYMACYSKLSKFDTGSGKETFPYFTGSDNLFYDYLESDPARPMMPTPTVFYKAQLYKEIGYYDEKYIGEDFDMKLRITYNYKTGFRDVYTIRYIIHPGSMTISNMKMVFKEMLDILKSKWAFIERYKRYRDKILFHTFCLLAKNHKREAIKYLFPSFRFFFSKSFIKNFLILLFDWPVLKKTA